MSNWDSHPIAKILSKYDINWRNVASSVNAEYRRIDKFVSGVSMMIYDDV
jgi:hypothetical protein